ncbi:hypothetical protein AY601_3466 [Pedobacter cryoconitis]|uniref:Uncharacterized protein n=1 Tax=Pedobacter cryoconitis TaxID=188932 RepID=A0A127VGI1_9SPHI|nr:hypothetical protein [Pedobacter cryoconitis]AMQ00332.1 hypothetical protein AY601_3466 [Pedobacter cryoconitis]
MDSKGLDTLAYTEDFRVACAINNLKLEDVLQYFVNRVSFYAFNGGEMEAVSLWATSIVIDCKKEVNAEVKAVTDRKVKRISLKYILMLGELNENPYLTTVDKMKESFNLMREWEIDMSPLVNYPRNFPLDDDQSLALTFDFNLLCRMNGVKAVQVLQYFMNNISMANERAINLIEFVETNSCMSLFGMIRLSLGDKKNSIPIHQEIHKRYGEKLLLLDDRLKKEENLDKRIAVYRAFYKEWYNSLRKNIN